MRVALLVLGLAVSAVAQSPRGPEELAAAGVARFTAAHEAWDRAGFEGAVRLFRKSAALAPGCARCSYWLGVSEFHRLLHLQHSPGATADRAAVAAAQDAAVAALVRTLELDEGNAEAHALLGTLYGMKIEGNLLRAARFGPRVQSHLNQALQLAPNNPRVLYLAASCRFHTASSKAGRQKALEMFQDAEKAFAAEAARPAAPLEPRWGWSACLTFLGRACEAVGKPAEAAVWFRQALAQHPADHVAAAGLARVTGSSGFSGIPK